MLQQVCLAYFYRLLSFFALLIDVWTARLVYVQGWQFGPGLDVWYVWMNECAAAYGSIAGWIDGIVTGFVCCRPEFM